MKISNKILLGISALGIMAFGAIKLKGAVIVFYGDLVNYSKLAYSTSHVFDLNKAGIKSLSVQVSMSSASPTASTFTDGTQSTGNITITSFAGLVESRSTASITVSSNTALAGRSAHTEISVASFTALAGGYARDFVALNSSFNINGGTLSFSVSENISGTTVTLTLGSSNQWNLGATTATSAANLAAAINSYWGRFNITASTFGVDNSSISIFSNSVGASRNYWALASNTQTMVVQFSSFIGGADPVTLTFNKYTVVKASHDWNNYSSSQATAIGIAAALDGIGWGVVASTFGTEASSVSLVVSQVGTSYNRFTLESSSPTALTVNSTYFYGGADPVFVQVNGVKFLNNADFYTGHKASNTAQNLEQAINASSATTLCTATGTQSGVVLLTTISSGSWTKFPLFTSSQTALTLSYVSTTFSGSTISAFAGGQDNAVLTLAGRAFTQGTSWYAQASNTDTAKNLSDYIMSTSLSSILITTWTINGTWGIIYATSVLNGTASNFSLGSSTQAIMVVSGVSSTTVSASTGAFGRAISTMTGGTDIGFSTITSIISITGHGYSTGMAVLLTTAATSDTNFSLYAPATYYVIIVDSNSIKLAAASTAAVAGSYIPLTKLSTGTAGHTFTLTPVPIADSWSGWFQVSNDSTTATWTNLPIATMTFVSPFVSSTTYTDIGDTNARYLKFTVNGSTCGAANIRVTINSKN